MEEREVDQYEDDKIWVIALTLVCVTILGYGFFYSENSTNDLPYLLGYNLVPALVLWGIFYYAVAKNKGKKIAGISFAAIFVSLVASSLIGYSQQIHEAKRAFSDIQDQYSELMDSSTDALGDTKRIEKPMDTTPIARGEIGEIERFMKEFINQVETQRNDYLLELEATGWNGILDANRIKVDNTFVGSKLTIMKAREVVSKYENRTQELFENTREKILLLNISESSKRNMQGGFEQGIENTEETIDTMWSLEKLIINEVENIVNLLATKRGSWFVDGEQVLFYSEDDVEQYNNHFTTIQNIAQQQEEIQRQNLQAINQNFDRMKEIE